MMKYLMLIVIFVLMVSACSSDGPPSNVQLPPSENAPGKVWDFDVNGTRCIAIYQNGGMAMQCAL